MAFKTLDEITQDVISNLSQAGGVGTQRYAEPRIHILINQCFKMLFDRQWWPEYMEWYTSCALDGTTGVVTTDISAIKRFIDIRAVFPAGSDKPLPMIPTEINPTGIPAGALTFIDTNRSTTKVFKVWSPTSTTAVTIHARLKPDDFTANDEISFDDLVLCYGAAWAYAEDDGTNPGATQKFQMLFENRLATIESALNSKPIALNARATYVPGQWWVDR